MDTAGQEEYSCLRDNHINSREAFLVGYAVDRMATFETMGKFVISRCPSLSLTVKIVKLVRRIQEIKGRPIQEIPMVVIGNRVDSIANREVAIMEGFEKAKLWNASYIETSPKYGINVDECFELLVEEWLKKNHFE